MFFFCQRNYKFVLWIKKKIGWNNFWYTSDDAYISHRIERNGNMTKCYLYTQSTNPDWSLMWPKNILFVLSIPWNFYTIPWTQHVNFFLQISWQYQSRTESRCNISWSALMSSFLVLFSCTASRLTSSEQVRFTPNSSGQVLVFFYLTRSIHWPDLNLHFFPSVPKNQVTCQISKLTTTQVNTSKIVFSNNFFDVEIHWMLKYSPSRKRLN